MAFLYLGHAIIGIALLAARPLNRRLRAAAVVVGSALGIGTGVALFLVRGSEEVWRTTEIDPRTGALLGLAVACSWLLLGALDGGRGRWDSGCLVGIACTGLLLFATNRWVVPGLLFWIVSSLAILVLIRGERGAASARVAVAASDAAVVGALAAYCLDHATWRMPAGTEGWPYWVILAAAVVRAGALPKTGVWGALALPGAVAGLPLLVAGSFSLLLGPGSGARVGAADVLLVVALTSCFWAFTSKQLPLTVVVAWPVALALGVALIAPQAVTRAGAAAILALSAAALWPHCLGQAEAERGLLLAFVPATAGFGVIVAGALEAFRRATETISVVDAAPWAAAAALLPTALAGGIALGARMGRRREPVERAVLPLGATWLVFGVALAVGFLPPEPVGLTAADATDRTVVLHVVALVAGIGAAVLIAGRREADVSRRKEGSLTIDVFAAGPSGAGALTAISAVVAVAAATGVLWLTYEGLKVGFL